MKSHIGKMIAPLIITVIMVLYFILYFGLIFHHTEGIWRFYLAIIPLILAGCMVYVCIERIKEIKKGEEDDISKY